MPSNMNGGTFCAMHRTSEPSGFQFVFVIKAQMDSLELLVRIELLFRDSSFFCLLITHCK